MLTGDTESVLWDEENLMVTGISLGEVTLYLARTDTAEFTSTCVIRVVEETTETEETTESTEETGTGN